MPNENKNKNEDTRTINEYRDQAGLKNADIAAYLSIHHRTLANVQNGKRKLSPAERAGLAALVEFMQAANGQL